MTSSLSVGQVARTAGVSTATVNYYVAQGILPPPRKLSRTRAAYRERHVRILKLVRRMQKAGYSLALIKASLRQHGTGDEGLRILEGIGRLQPIPPSRAGDPAIDHFAPLDRDAFAKKADVPRAFLALLESHGLLRPVHGRYDARDLWAVRAVSTMIDDGLPRAKLAALYPLVRAALALAELTRPVLADHRDRLMKRELRARDFYAPYVDLMRYLVDRGTDEQAPGWRERLLAETIRPE